jgi:hypothetical protein
VGQLPLTGPASSPTPSFRLGRNLRSPFPCSAWPIYARSSRSASRVPRTNGDHHPNYHRTPATLFWRLGQSLVGAPVCQFLPPSSRNRIVLAPHRCRLLRAAASASSFPRVTRSCALESLGVTDRGLLGASFASRTAATHRHFTHKTRPPYHLALAQSCSPSVAAQVE